MCHRGWQIIRLLLVLPLHVTPRQLHMHKSFTAKEAGHMYICGASPRLCTLHCKSTKGGCMRNMSSVDKLTLSKLHTGFKASAGHDLFSKVQMIPNCSICRRDLLEPLLSFHLILRILVRVVNSGKVSIMATHCFRISMW